MSNNMVRRKAIMITERFQTGDRFMLQSPWGENEVVVIDRHNETYEDSMGESHPGPWLVVRFTAEDAVDTPPFELYEPDVEAAPQSGCAEAIS